MLKNKIKNNEFTDALNQKSASKIVKKITQGDKEDKRYLFEITMPKVSINYKHHNLQVQLATEDVEHL